MAIRDALLPEFDQETASTRRTLERVPQDRFDWSPHQKSGTMVWLAGHLANLPSWVTLTLGHERTDAGCTIRRSRHVGRRGGGGLPRRASGLVDWLVERS